MDRRFIGHLRTRWNLVLSLALAPLLCAPVTLADETDAEADDASVVIEPRGGGIDAAPITGTGLGSQVPISIGSTHFRPIATRLVPEGTLLVERRGRVHRLATGRLVFVFDADETGQADPPMFLQPSVRTMQLERVIGDRGPATTVKLTGRVMAYRGWNYLKPSAFSILEREPTGEGEAQPTPNQAEPPAQPTSLDELFDQPIRSPDGGERTAADVLAELERRPPEEGVYTPPPVVEITDARGVLAEGRVLVSRRGRILPHAGGGLEFEFDSGPNDPPGMDQPLILMPCLLLERIEAAVAQRRGATLTLSGQIFGYGDHAFLLPTMFVMERARSENVVSTQ